MCIPFSPLVTLVLQILQTTFATRTTLILTHTLVTNGPILFFIFKWAYLTKWQINQLENLLLLAKSRFKSPLLPSCSHNFLATLERGKLIAAQASSKSIRNNCCRRTHSCQKQWMSQTWKVSNVTNFFLQEQTIRISIEYLKLQFLCKRFQIRDKHPFLIVNPPFRNLPTF